MGFDDYFAFLRELRPTLPLYISVFIGAAIVRWVMARYRQVYERHGAPLAACGLPGELVAQRLVAESGLGQVRVVRRGQRDLYHPWKREIRLSAITFSSPSLGALVTAAHEVGHAQQFAERILLCRLRQFIWPTCWGLIGLAFVL